MIIIILYEGGIHPLPNMWMNCHLNDDRSRNETSDNTHAFQFSVRLENQARELRAAVRLSTFLL
jgi:hypothetical protein